MHHDGSATQICATVSRAIELMVCQLITILRIHFTLHNYSGACFAFIASNPVQLYHMATHVGYFGHFNHNGINA